MTTKTLRLPNKKKMTSLEVKQFTKTVNSFITINKKRRDLLKQENAFKDAIHTMLDKYNMKSFTLKNGNGIERITITKDKLDKENNYFEIRSKRAKIIKRRSNFNFFVFQR